MHKMQIKNRNSYFYTKSYLIKNENLLFSIKYFPLRKNSYISN